MPATKTRLTAKTDPEAAELAAAAKVIAREAGLKSAYTTGEGRSFLDHITVAKTRGALVLTKDDGDAVKVTTAKVKAFIAGGKDADTAAVFAALARGLDGMHYGRKTACYALAAAAR